MKRILGILSLFLVVYLATWVLADLLTGESRFLTAYNQQNLLRRIGLYGILAIGVAFVIITGGIDLSIGSVVCLIGVSFPVLVIDLGISPWLSIVILALIALSIGILHGTLITLGRLQPFIVTLCGLLIYRGITRGFTGDQTAGFGSEFRSWHWLASGAIPVPGIDGFGIPIPFVILLILAAGASLFLNRSIYGRYLLALGNNEEAARYSGIRTKRLVILAYVICAMLAGLGGVLFVLDNNQAMPSSFGNFYELYAIAAAVLGGCSLRGGSGTILGVLIGTALIRLISNMINLVDSIPSNIEFAVIGGVILAGAVGEEVVKRLAGRRRFRGTDA
ncbi:MAG: ABC transporter permease [Verrucomicrobiota bacterium]